MNQPSRQAVNRVFCHDPDNRAVQLNTDSLPSVVASHGVAATADRQGEKQMSRHEVFTNAAPATGAVLTTALEHSAFTEETAGPDPVFNLITAEANAFARFNTACGNTDSVALGREPTAEEEAEYVAANNAQEAALVRVLQANARTPEALCAMIDLFERREMESVSAPVDEFLSGLFQSVRRFVMRSGCDGEAHAPLSDLASACLQEAERWQWLDNNENTIDMSEKDWDAEFKRQSEVWHRALTEPSASLRDLAAKAEMLREDLDRFHPENEKQTSDFRLMRVVLGEIVKMGSPLAAELTAPASAAPLHSVDSAFRTWIEAVAAFNRGEIDPPDSAPDPLLEALDAAEDAILNLPRSTPAAACMLLVDLSYELPPKDMPFETAMQYQDDLIKVRVLEALRPHLSGIVARVAADLLDNPTRPAGESLLWKLRSGEVRA